MSLKLNIEKEIKQAMFAKDKDRLRALRSIKSLILLAETEKDASAELSPEGELKILTKAAKQRRDSLSIYIEQGRNDLAEVEKQELDVIEKFLPKQLDSSELESELRLIIEEIGASGPQDMGKVMGIATKKLAGQADGKAVSTKVKELLMM